MATIKGMTKDEIFGNEDDENDDGNILTLQKILGHSDIQMTMLYAHLSEDHLNEALTYSPL